jgi:Membrane bound beta barrel domain (DUF5777)
MKKCFWIFLILLPLQLFAQDSTINDLMKDMDAAKEKKVPVKIFNSERAINVNTTEIVPKGKLDFNVMHNFGDIAGRDGGTKTFFGLDAVADARIGFHLGLTDRLNLNLARAAGGGTEGILRVIQLYEIALKYQLLRQFENDPTHPLAVTIFFNNVISAMPTPTAGQTEPWRPNRFNTFGDRMSQVFQVMIAKKIGKVSLQVNPTVVRQGLDKSYDQKTIFALGGIIRVPITRNLNLVVDYTHPFRSKRSRDAFGDTSKTQFKIGPPTFGVINLFDPLGIGVEITTAGHIFHLNFTNAREILENRLIPYTSKTWGKGQYRWGFTISRKFTVWRPKK